MRTTSSWPPGAGGDASSRYCPGAATALDPTGGAAPRPRRAQGWPAAWTHGTCGAGLSVVSAP
jgi:hypothetical protein